MSSGDDRKDGFRGQPLQASQPRSAAHWRCPGVSPSRPGAPAARRHLGRRPGCERPRLRHLQAADRDQHHRFGRQRHGRGRGHGEALPRCRLCGRRHGGAGRTSARRIWWCACTAPASTSRCCSSGIWTWWRRGARTGAPIPSSSSRRTAIFYGRGSSDMKDGDAIMATALLRMKQEGYRPSRDIILALTADEEGGCCNGANWLLENHRDLVDAEFVLNHDGDSVMSEHGVPQVFGLGATEKVYARLPAERHQPRRSQLAAAARQRHLRARRGLDADRPASVSVRAQQRHPRLLRAHGDDATGSEAADMRAHLASPPDPQAIERLSRGRLRRSCARPASRPGSRAGMRTTRCRSARKRW